MVIPTVALSIGPRPSTSRPIDARIAADTALTSVAAEYKDQKHTHRGGYDMRQQYPKIGTAFDPKELTIDRFNAWYGEHNKWVGARWIVRELLGRDLAQELDRWVFVGDSGNDQAMFEHFMHSVGVANIARFVPQLTHLPRYVTPSERGAGFAEVARAILQARQP